MAISWGGSDGHALHHAASLLGDSGADARVGRVAAATVFEARHASAAPNSMRCGGAKAHASALPDTTTAS